MKDGATKKRTKNEALLLKRYESSVTSQKPVRQQKETKKSPDKKNPRDVSIDAMAVEALGVTSNTERDHHHQDGASKRRRGDDTHATQLLPMRDAQTRDTLDIRANRTPNAPSPSGGHEAAAEEDGGGGLYSELIRVNTELYRQRNDTTFALQDLVRLGVLTPHAQPVGLKRVQAAHQLSKDVDFMRNQIEQLAHGRTTAAPPPAQPRNTMVLAKSVSKKSGLVSNGGGKPVQVKMSLLFGPINYSFGYEKRASSDHREFVAREWERDREERKRRFYLGDSVERDVEFQSLPHRFKLFRQLLQTNVARFASRTTLHANTTALVPRTDLETVSRAHLTASRKRPKEGEQKCFRGTRCVGYSVGTDPTLWYTMKAFYTQRQQEQAYYNGEALCADCYMYTWTLQCLDNIANERVQKVPLNHFTVIVGEGEYGSRAMLPIVFNRLETGIVGCVPFYHAEYRQMRMSSVTTERTSSSSSQWSGDGGRKKRKVDTDSESYIAETGVLDF